MHLFLHKGRHIVVSETEKPESGEISVRWVALVSTVSGTAKRGRRPNYKKPIPVSELVELDENEATDAVKKIAQTVLSLDDQ